jgi:hypothetical protein
VNSKVTKVPLWVALGLAPGGEMADEYEATFKIVVSKSPLRDGWYGRILVSEDEHLDTNLTGYGATAMKAAQGALQALTVDTAYVTAILEAALLRGTRMAGRQITDGKKKR